MSYPVYERLIAWFDAIKGDYVTQDVVRAFIANEKAEHAAEFSAFADILAYNALMQRATSQRASRRMNARREAKRQAIRPRVEQAATNRASGKPTGLFEQRFKVDEKGTQRTAAEMDGPAHLFVASQYAHHSRQSSLEAAFHKAVAKKCGRRRTDEVYTAEEYEVMYRSIVARSDAA